MILKFFSRLGFRGGLCEQFERAVDELTHEAKALNSYIEVHKRAEVPFASVLSTMWNNHQWAKFIEHPVDGGNGSGVRKRPIEARQAIR